MGELPQPRPPRLLDQLRLVLGVQQLNALGAGGGGADPCDTTRHVISQVAAQSRSAGYGYINSHRGRNGYYIYYSMPPSYCGQTAYTPVPRPYYASNNEAYRTIDMMANNGYRIDYMGTW